jgi:hypothetical protein
VIGDLRTAAVDRRMGLRPGALRALRVLEACPMLPADVIGPIVGLASQSAAYKQLARLRSGGLADVRDEDPGFLFGGPSLRFVEHHRSRSSRVAVHRSA